MLSYFSYNIIKAQVCFSFKKKNDKKKVSFKKSVSAFYWVYFTGSRDKTKKMVNKEKLEDLLKNKKKYDLYEIMGKIIRWAFYKKKKLLDRKKIDLIFI